MTDANTSRLVTVNADEARHFRVSCRFEGQRKISVNNVARLRKAMENGTFNPGTPITFCVLPNGELYLVNGHHTLEAIIACGIPQLLTIIVVEVANKADVARIYSNFDIHKTRSWSDFAHAHNLDKEFPLTNYVMPALGLVMQDFKYSSDNIEANSSREKRLELLNEYREPATLMADAIKGAPAIYRRLCLRRAVLGVALLTLKHQAPTAYDFWHGLSRDDGLAANDPRKTLLRFLLDNKITGPIENFRQSKAVSLAWNAYYRDEDLTLLRPGAVNAVVLVGTPYGTTRAAEKLPPARPPQPLPTPGAFDHLFTTGIQTGPEGSRPVTRLKKTVKGE